MNFTATPPTKPGFYALKLHGRISGIRLEEHCQQLVNPETIKGGLWCRLVPADEVEKAYEEGVNISDDLSMYVGWNNSRAKRVMEGEE